ncbi:forkhead box protein M1-like [Brachionichthys hirsutus]|uniref:forkhead box protein M1-like n=1 Tax=Brachionichthys hirsutus TaxID=412623 RepID=UPI0036051824
MRRSPRRPLILGKRKLPFQLNDSAAPAVESQSLSDTKQPSRSAANQCFPDGVHILDHPSLSDTQVVVIPKTADLHTIIGALTAKGKESGVRGPNKFILLGANGRPDDGSHSQSEGDGASTRSEFGGQVKKEDMPPPEVKAHTGIKKLIRDLDCGPLDDSLNKAEWQDKTSTKTLEPDFSAQMDNKENLTSTSQTSQTQTAPSDADAAAAAVRPISERPPYSYMAMIQFAINSQKDRRMTLKEIYTWIEDNFPYFRKVAKPGWKNSIRHNLSLHDMFIRGTSLDAKVSYWTIQPEANRCLTLEQVYKPGFHPATASSPVPLHPQQQLKRLYPDPGKTPVSSERKMKPLLPRTDSYLVPIQLPLTSSLYLPSSARPVPCARSQQKRNTSREAKRVRIAPKVTQSDVPAPVMCPEIGKDLIKVEVSEEPVCVPIKCENPEAVPKPQASGSRRKQCLVHAPQEEPVLLYPDNTFLDSGVASDASAFQDVHDMELDEHQSKQQGSDQDLSFKTPIKSSSHLTSSTPSKAPSDVFPDTWKVTPVGKGGQGILDFSPIRTPGGPAVTPRHDYTTFSFNMTPFKEWNLFGSPREQLTSGPSRTTGPADSPVQWLQQDGGSRDLHTGGASTPSHSITEGLVLDTMNDSLSKILVDISFSALDEEDLGIAQLSWSEFIPQFK